jgi:hypothetical protein
MAIVATQHRCALIGRPQDGVFSPADDPRIHLANTSLNFSW